MILYDGRGSSYFADVRDNGAPASLLAVKQPNQY
jgi:hypothetical protein